MPSRADPPTLLMLALTLASNEALRRKNRSSGRTDFRRGDRQLMPKSIPPDTVAVTCTFGLLICTPSSRGMLTLSDSGAGFHERLHESSS